MLIVLFISLTILALHSVQLEVKIIHLGFDDSNFMVRYVDLGTNIAYLYTPIGRLQVFQVSGFVRKWDLVLPWALAWDGNLAHFMRRLLVNRVTWFVRTRILSCVDGFSSILKVLELLF